MRNFAETYPNIFLSLSKIDITEITKEKSNQRWNRHLDVTHFVKLFFNLEVANSHLFPFAFMLIFILVYNLESYGYF